MFPMNICLTANIWKEAGAKWGMNPLPEVDDGVFYCVVSHTKCRVTRAFRCCEVELMNTAVLEAPSRLSSISVRPVMEG